MRQTSDMSIEGATYDVALSFAAEDRVYVAEVAAALREAGVDLFYDDYAVVELWGENLVDAFEEVYNRRSKYVALFVSYSYVAKSWTRHERQSAQARALVEDGAYVLPIKLDDAELPGMPSTVSYVDGQRFSPAEVADLICKKLGHAPSTAIEVPALGAPRNQQEVIRLLAVRPGAWEYLLWAGLIYQGVKAVEPKWHDHRLRIRQPGGPRHTGQETIDLLGAATDRIVMTMDNLMAVLSEDAQAVAFGLPGEPGDPEAIEHLAKRYASSYEYLLDWATEVRSLHVIEELSTLRDITARMSDMAIDQIRAFVDRIVVETEAAAIHVASGSEEQLTVTLMLTLEMDPVVMAAHAKELKRLERVFRRGWPT